MTKQKTSSINSVSHIYRPNFRRRKAYWTALVVLWSYVKIYLLGKILGQNYYQTQLQHCHIQSAERIKDTILELQGLFVKFGQLLSIMSNILPEELRQPLAKLQDKNAERPYSEVAQTIENQLDKSIHQIFTTFDSKPIAAASIGQVHRATIGKQVVAVKIQHANIERIAEADLSILKNLVYLSSLIWDIKGINHSYEQVRLMIEEELDYEREADAMQRIQQNLQGQSELRVVIPRVWTDFCAQKIIVTDFCEGVNIGQMAIWTSWGVMPADLIDRLIRLFCHKILVDGYYHADPHPGNILINPKGEIILLDFGAVAHLNDAMKAAIPELIEAMLKNDNEKMIVCWRQMGFISNTKNANRVAEKFLHTIKDFLQSEVKVDQTGINVDIHPERIFQLISDLNITQLTNTFQVPKDWVLLNRTLVLLGGLSNQIAPQYNPLQTIQPYLKQHLLKKEGGFAQLIINALKTQAVTAFSLPNDLSKFLQKANKGKLQLEIQDLHSGIQLLYALGQQILFAIFFFGSAYAALYIDVKVYPRWSVLFTILSVWALLGLFRAWWRGNKLQ